MRICCSVVYCERGRQIRREKKHQHIDSTPNQSVVSPLNLYRSPCVAACLAPESAIPKLVPGDTGYALPISRIHLFGYLVEDGITSSVHAKHTFSRTSIMLRFSKTPLFGRSCISKERLIVLRVNFRQPDGVQLLLLVFLF